MEKGKGEKKECACQAWKLLPRFYLVFQGDFKTRKGSAVAMLYRTLVKVYENIYTIRTSTGMSIIGLVI